MFLKFPKNFFWGASTSAYQVEGSNLNNWSKWEQKNALKLAKTAEKKFKTISPIWLEIKKEAQNPKNYLSGKACDHYHRFEEDFKLAQSLGLNAYRFSLEWSRIEPQKGHFNLKAIQNYQDMINALREKGIEPFVTLWHWTLPIWLEKKGWTSAKTIHYFCRYVRKVVSSLKGVNFWITINEPLVFSSYSYLTGLWPPQKKNPYSTWLVLRNLNQAHRKAFKVIKKINPQAQIGIAKNNIYFEAYQDKLFNRILKAMADCFWNFYFLNQIKDYQDFIGLNHYFHNRIQGWFNQNEDKKISDLGWELYPQSIYFALKDLKKYQKPIYITENGLADCRDQQRAWYIKETLKNVHRALAEGVDIRGYLHWSLLDNFEWDKGFWPRFGLIEVDYQTMQRKIRPSAWEYAKIIQKNGLNLEE